MLILSSLANCKTKIRFRVYIRNILYRIKMIVLPVSMFTDHDSCLRRRSVRPSSFSAKEQQINKQNKRSGKESAYRPMEKNCKRINRAPPLRVNLKTKKKKKDPTSGAVQGNRGLHEGREDLRHDQKEGREGRGTRWRALHRCARTCHCSLSQVAR